jgi:hypothetical protein
MVLLAFSVLRRSGQRAVVSVATDARADVHRVWWKEPRLLEPPAIATAPPCALARDPREREALLERNLARPHPTGWRAGWRCQPALGLP